MTPECALRDLRHKTHQNDPDVSLARNLRYNFRTCQVAWLPKDRPTGFRGTWLQPTQP